jgi:hypothetical protein
MPPLIFLPYTFVVMLLMVITVLIQCRFGIRDNPAILPALQSELPIFDITHNEANQTGFITISWFLEPQYNQGIDFMPNTIHFRIVFIFKNVLMKEILSICSCNKNS